jgi:hypothetical protein
MVGIAERLRAKATIDLAGCWIWQGALDPSGYGAIKADGKKRNTHRVSYETFVGPVPRARVVCHRCHNPRCINPDHLYAGSRAENLRDAIRAGRNTLPRLTAAEIAAIRRSRKPRSWIAQRYGVALSTVSKIVRGQTHAPTP